MIQRTSERRKTALKRFIETGNRLVFRAKNMMDSLEDMQSEDFNNQGELLTKDILYLAKYHRDFAYSFDEKYEDSMESVLDFASCNNVFSEKIIVEFENPCVYHASFFTPPLFKKVNAKTAFKEIFTLPLLEKTVSSLPHDFKKFDQAYVIYVNHASKNEIKTPYYDNDNLAIKLILDAVVPVICFDDCIKYCEDIYLTVADNGLCSDLYIVKKGSLRQWLIEHQHIPFSKEVVG